VGKEFAVEKICRVVEPRAVIIQLIELPRFRLRNIGTAGKICPTVEPRAYEIRLLVEPRRLEIRQLVEPHALETRPPVEFRPVKISTAVKLRPIEIRMPEEPRLTKIRNPVKPRPGKIDPRDRYIRGLIIPGTRAPLKLSISRSSSGFFASAPKRTMMSSEIAFF